MLRCPCMFMGTGAVGGLVSDQSNSNSSSPVSIATDMDSEPNCEACLRKFNLITKRRKTCFECSKQFCSRCLAEEPHRPRAERRCHKCRVFSADQLDHSELMKLRVKDLKQYLLDRRIPSQFCTEKTDLVELIIRASANPSLSSRRVGVDRSPRMPSPAGDFTTGPGAAPAPQDEVDTQTVTEISRSANNNPPSPRDNVNAREQTNADDQIGESASGENSINDHVPTLDGAGERPGAETGNTADNAESEINNTTSDGSNPDLTTAAEPVNADASAQEQVTTESDAGAGENEGTEPMEWEGTVTQDELTNEQTDAPLPPSTKTKTYYCLDEVESLEAIDRLSIRQLKEILAHNFVIYKGCVEKWELQERVRRLFNEATAAKEKLNSAEQGKSSRTKDPEDGLCKICMDAVVDCVLLDCGHMLTCTNCGKQLNECPICRQYVVRVVHVFRS